jgi:hypothetical protein
MYGMSKRTGGIQIKPSQSQIKSPSPSARKLLCSQIATLKHGLRNVDALLEEISEQSVVLSTDCPLQRDSAVRIDCGTCQLSGKVATCTEWLGGYRSEVLFAANKPWAPDNFKPDRLFNPNSLTCTRPGCSSDCVQGECVSA